MILRRRARPDGELVDALAWTTLATDCRLVLLNTENDDSGEIDRAPCGCLLGRMGMQSRLRAVRGLTKSVASGVTVPGDILQRLVDDVLPRTVAGEPGQWQLVERQDAGRTIVELRLDPAATGAVDEAEVKAHLFAALRETDTGALAAAVWSTPGALRFVREPPLITKAGKTLPYDVLDRYPT